MSLSTPLLLRKSILIVLFIFTIISAFSSPFEIVKMTEDEITLKFNLPDYSFQQFNHEGVDYQKITGKYFSYHTKEGYPLLPFFSESIGIPSDGSISLSVYDIEESFLDNVLIYPTEKIAVVDEETVYEFYQDRQAYNSRTDYPAQVITNGVSAYAADRKFSSFILNPFIYNASSKKLRVVNSAMIRINVSGDKTQTRNYIPDRTYIDKSKFLINDEYSKHWRKTREYNPKYNSNRSSAINQIHLIVDKNGIYRVGYSDLREIIESAKDKYVIDFHIDNLDPRYLYLSSKDGTIPIHFVGERDGSFDEDDYFEFYGKRNYGKEGYYDSYTAENVYTLSIGNNWGARISVQNGGIVEVNPRNYIVPQSYEQTVHFEEQLSYNSLSTYYKAEREDLWFWKIIRAPDLSITSFQLEYPHDSYSRGFSAEVGIVGLTNINSQEPDHHSRVRINSAFVNAHRWHGQSEQIFRNDAFLSNTYLTNGTNHLYIDMPGDTPAANMEAILLDYFKIRYWREYRTNCDEIEFSKPSNTPFGLYQFELHNFSSNDVSIYKINSGFMENIRIEAFSETGTAPYKVSFQDNVVSNDTKYIALTEANKLKPKEIRIKTPSDLLNPNNRADYIIITGTDFIEEEGSIQLKNTWEELGVTVQLIDIQHIFNEFNYGIRSAQAMKDFFSYAFNNWELPMTHTLLLGKGLFDERDFSVHRNSNIIPYKNVWTYKVGATPSDNWFACVVGDDPVPDFNISRVSAWRGDQIKAVADKTVHYLNNPNKNDLWQSRVTLTAGGKSSDAYDIFAQQSELIRSRWLPNDYHIIRVYTDTQTVSNQYLGGTFRLKDAWDSGTAIIQFMGHGGGRIWADYNLLNNNDIVTLNNKNYPFVSSLSCYPSDFSRPGAGSIGENMVLIANKGAIAHLGFSGLGYLNEDLIVGYAFAEAIYHRNILNFGDISSFTRAKTFTNITNIDPQTALTHASVLFGDPMLSFDLPKQRIEIELDSYNVVEGDTLSITAVMGNDISFARIHIQNTNEINQNIPFDIPVVNGIFETKYVVPVTPQSTYKRIIKIFGYGSDKQVLGRTSFAVGLSAVTDNVTIPEIPTAADSVHIAAKIFNKEGVNNVLCRSGTITRQMVFDETEQRYITIQPLPKGFPGALTSYRFIITNGLNQVVESELFYFRVFGPDLAVSNLEISSLDNKPAVKVLVKNLGDYSSPTASIRLFKRIGNDETIITEKTIAGLSPLEDRWVYLSFEPINETLRFRVHVNPTSAFSEMSYVNNSILSPLKTINMFYAGLTPVTHESTDGNAKFVIPANMFDEEKVFFINETPFSEPVNQPDVSTVYLMDANLSKSYSISYLSDLGVEALPQDKKITVTFNYQPGGDNQIWSDYLTIYRWENEYKKWLHQGGFINSANHTVYQELNQLGTYTLLINRDTQAPEIKANVQDQEFTFGGYVSGDGVVSFTLSDANGIDIFEEGIALFLNGQKIDEIDYTISANLHNLISIPIKYQLDLLPGDYTLFSSCRDVNGNFKSHEIKFVVNNTFEVLNLANYPNPVITNTIEPNNENRTRFTYVLTDDADDVKIKLYTVSGRLVKTFNNLPSGIGYHEYPRTVFGWDCRDDKGVLLANGIYFYKLIARKGSNTIEKTQKMAITR